MDAVMMELETALVFPKTPRNGLRSAGVHAGGSTPSFEAETREPVSEPAFHKSGKLEDFEEIILPHLTPRTILRDGFCATNRTRKT
jgi:hypothetical protein